MTDSLQLHLETFKNFPREAKAHLQVEPLCDYGWLIKPKRTAVALPAGKEVGLTLMGLTHGNELAGVAVINEVLAHLGAGNIALKIPLAIILGNPWAAKENRRFLERDLNRSFGCGSATLKEEVRAKELTSVLDKTAFLLDLHQTTRPSDRPFFIFGYNERNYEFARAISPRLTIVTHWGKPFSNEGMCTDEYVISKGGTGISLELGQNGFDSYQIAVGVEACLWAIRVATAELNSESIAHRASSHTSELYTWAEIMRWPAHGFVELNAGLNNFAEVHVGDILGRCDGEPVRAGASGRILFPKYLSRAEQEKLSVRPSELCRVMKAISPAELPVIKRPGS